MWVLVICKSQTDTTSDYKQSRPQTSHEEKWSSKQSQFSWVSVTV